MFLIAEMTETMDQSLRERICHLELRSENNIHPEGGKLMEFSTPRILEQRESKLLSLIENEVEILLIVGYVETGYWSG